jgi:hypothetical protein
MGSGPSQNANLVRVFSRNRFPTYVSLFFSGIKIKIAETVTQWTFSLT